MNKRPSRTVLLAVRLGFAVQLSAVACMWLGAKALEHLPHLSEKLMDLDRAPGNEVLFRAGWGAAVVAAIAAGLGFILALDWNRRSKWLAGPWIVACGLAMGFGTTPFFAVKFHMDAATVFGLWAVSLLAVDLVGSLARPVCDWRHSLVPLVGLVLAVATGQFHGFWQWVWYGCSLLALVGGLFEGQGVRYAALHEGEKIPGLPLKMGVVLLTGIWGLWIKAFFKEKGDVGDVPINHG